MKNKKTLDQFKDKHYGLPGTEKRDNLEAGYETFKANLLVTEKGYPKATIVEKGRSHANDPFFVKKLEEAKAALSKITLPGNSKK